MSDQQRTDGPSGERAAPDTDPRPSAGPHPTVVPAPEAAAPAVPPPPNAVAPPAVGPPPAAGAPAEEEPTLLSPVVPAADPGERTVNLAPAAPAAPVRQPPARAAEAAGERTVNLLGPADAEPPATRPAVPATEIGERTVNLLGPAAAGGADTDATGPAEAAEAAGDPAGAPAAVPVTPTDAAGPGVVREPDDHPPASGTGDHLAASTADGEPSAPTADPVPSPDPDGTVRAAGDATPSAGGAQPAPWRRLSSAGALIWVLIALFGFTLVVQLRSNDTDQGLAATRPDDLVRILSDLEARETRLNSEIHSLEESQRQLTSGVQGRQAALEEADRRANELGLLAGTLRGRGPGLVITMTPGDEPIKASAILNTVQELRGSGGEVMQIAGSDGTAVRVVASTAFVDGDGGRVVVDGVRLSGPFVLTVIGAPQTMEPALNIPGGVVASVGNAGGTVIAEQRKTVEVTAVREAINLQYARPVS